MKTPIFLSFFIFFAFTVSAQEFSLSENYPDVPDFQIENETYDIGIQYLPEKNENELNSEVPTPVLEWNVDLTDAEIIRDALWGRLNSSIQTENPMELHWELWKEAYLLRLKKNHLLLQNQNSCLTLGE